MQNGNEPSHEQRAEYVGMIDRAKSIYVSYCSASSGVLFSRIRRPLPIFHSACRRCPARSQPAENGTDARWVPRQ